MRQKSLYRIASIFCFTAFLQTPMLADTPERVCDTAIHKISKTSKVPLSILQSITRVEAGKVHNGSLTPWPWTANVGGQGYYFDTKQEAVNFALNLISRDIINFDVGCFQINLRWHSNNFVSIEDALDPVANTTYAAKFLTQLYHQKGNWSGAVSSYHSSTPELAKSYLQKVKAVWHDLQQEPVLIQEFNTVSNETVVVKQYQLLQEMPPNFLGIDPNNFGSLIPNVALPHTFFLKLAK